MIAMPTRSGLASRSPKEESARVADLVGHVVDEHLVQSAQGFVTHGPRKRLENCEVRRSLPFFNLCSAVGSAFLGRRSQKASDFLLELSERPIGG